MLILILFIFSILLLGSYHIGGLSIRVIFTVVIAGYLFFNKKNTKITFDSTPVYLYLIFILVSVICKILSGGFSGMNELGPLIKRIFANYVVCIIVYYAIDAFVKTYRDLNKILILLISICLINDIATLLQYMGNPIGIAIGLLFTTNESEYFTRIADNLHRVTEMKAAMPGIFGHGAINGYMTASLGILSLYYLCKDTHNIGEKILGIILYIFAAIGTFCCQERSGFGLFIMFSFLILWRFYGKLIKYLLPIIFIAAIIFIGKYFVVTDHIDNLGRYSNLLEFDDDRKDLLYNAIDFIQNNILLGGEMAYEHIYGLTPHNVLLHAFIYSGLIGAAIIIYLTFYMISQGCKIIFKPQQVRISYFFACSLLIYILNGFVHSASLITGEVIIWILYASMMKSYSLRKLQNTNI